MAYEVAFIDGLLHNPDLDRWEVLVRWAGFEQSESTCESGSPKVARESAALSPHMNMESGICVSVSHGS
jgi:hypothetical protein